MRSNLKKISLVSALLIVLALPLSSAATFAKGSGITTAGAQTHFMTADSSAPSSQSNKIG